MYQAKSKQINAHKATDMIKPLPNCLFKAILSREHKPVSTGKAGKPLSSSDTGKHPSSWRSHTQTHLLGPTNLQVI